jgi:hypothetical protein
VVVFGTQGSLWMGFQSAMVWLVIRDEITMEWVLETDHRYFLTGAPMTLAYAIPCQQMRASHKTELAARSETQCNWLSDT